MITLTISGGGTATDDSTVLTAGRRYVFQFAADVLNGTSAGTLVTANDWGNAGTAVPQFRNAAGTVYSYDLAAVTSGSFEFTAAADGRFRVNVSGAGVADQLHFNVSPITG
jgi:hypothetical protein